MARKYTVNVDVLVPIENELLCLVSRGYVQQPTKEIALLITVHVYIYIYITYCIVTT